MEDMQKRGEWPGRYQQEVSTIMDTVADGAVQVGAASLATGGFAHLALRAAMPRWVSEGTSQSQWVEIVHEVVGCRVAWFVPS